MPATVIKGMRLFLSKKFVRVSEFMKISVVNLTSLKSTEKKNKSIPE